MISQDLPKTWRTVPLGKCCTIVSGATPRRDTPRFWNGTIPWVTPRELGSLGDPIIMDTAEMITEEGQRSCSAQLLPVGAVLFSSRAPIGHVAIVGKAMCTNQGFKSLVSGPDVDSRYLYRCIKYITPLIVSKGRGATFKEVSKSVMENIEIPLPLPEEQRRIATILDNADSIRRDKEIATQELASSITSLFYDMFGDPQTNPKGFSLRPLGDKTVALINPRRDNNSDDATLCSFVPMADVDEHFGEIVGTQVRKVGEVKKGFTAFSNGDVLFAKITPCMQNGKAAVARNLTNGIGFGSTEFHVLRPGRLATAAWLHTLVRLPVFRFHASKSFTGSAGQQRVPTTFLKTYEIPLPPIELQNEFGRVLKKLLNLQRKNRQMLAEVNRLYASLVQRAFRGEL